eukprot:scaffold650062_cov52-Prasinocladus_malaysianus.AAC.1
MSFLVVAESITGAVTRDEYYSRVQQFLCAPGQCEDKQVPSCYLNHGTAMTEHQKLQLDLFHIKPEPTGADE